MSKGHRTSDQRSEIQRSDLLRTDIVPKLIAFKSILNQKRIDATTVERLWRLLPQPARAIIIGRRPQERTFRSIKKRDPYLQSIRDAFRYPVQLERKQEGVKTVCQKRDERRETLFSMGIAGINQRKSPGQGGSYKRNKDSQIECKKER